MSTLSTAPIGLPPTTGLWSRLKHALSAPAQATGGLEHRVSELELKVSVLQAQVAYAQGQLQDLGAHVDTWGAPKAVLPTDVYLADRRYTETGEAYWTTANGPTDRWISGARVSDDGSQVMVALP